MKIIGHRGARGLAPENTVASLLKALEHHVDLVEFDVRVTRDHVPILHHNPKLADPNGEKHVIAKTDYLTLKQHKPDLATLDEALKAIGNKTPLYIEVKPHADTMPIIKTFGQHVKLNNYWLASKNQQTLVALHKALPDVPKIVIEPWNGVRARTRARQVNAKIVSMNKLWLWPGFISAVTHGGLELYAYTLNDPKKAKRWEKYGLSGIVTDFPDRFEKF